MRQPRFAHGHLTCEVRERRRCALAGDCARSPANVRGASPMKRIRKRTIAYGAAVACVLGWAYVRPPSDVSAQETFPDPNADCPPAQCGQVSPLIPMQSTEAVHMGLVWKKNSQEPKILYHARFPEYAPNDVADPELTDLAIQAGALVTAGNQFNTSLRDVLHG